MGEMCEACGSKLPTCVEHGAWMGEMCEACGSKLPTRVEHVGVRAVSPGPIPECAVDRTVVVLRALVSAVKRRTSCK